MISIGLFIRYRLIHDLLTDHLSRFSDFEISLSVDDKDVLIDKLRYVPVNVLLMYCKEINFQDLNLIVHLNLKYPRIKVLILSDVDHQDFVLKSIKAGAKGFVTTHSAAEDLAEAIYTLRNGHDFYSKQITHMLLNQYIENIDGLGWSSSGLEHLSARQIEILKLWGDNCSNQEIADRLFISVRTVETHKNHIMQKLNLKSTIDLVKFAIKNNIISI